MGSGEIRLKLMPVFCFLLVHFAKVHISAYYVCAGSVSMGNVDRTGLNCMCFLERAGERKGEVGRRVDYPEEIGVL